MKKTLALILAISMSVSLFSGCGNNNEAKNKTSNKQVNNKDNESNNKTTSENNETNREAVVINNFEQETTYEKVPDKVICLDYSMAEILAALGLGDKIIGIEPAMNTPEELEEEYRDIIKSKKVFEDVSLEVLLEHEPDLILMPSYYFNMPTFGKKEDFSKAKINLYVAEGTYEKEPSVDNTYNDIENIGKIFNKEEEAKKIIEGMRAQVEAVEEKLKGIEPVSVCIYDSGTDKAFSAGGTSLENKLVEIAGGKNIFGETKYQFLQVGWEEIIQQNPKVIVVNAYGAVDDGDKKIEYLKSLPELAEVDAVKNNRFIPITLYCTRPGIQNGKAIEIFAKGLHPEAFK